MKPSRPGTYVRISDDREGEAKGVKRQLEDCRALVEQRGWPVAAEYNDNDVSAWKRGIVRPQYRQMLDDIANGVIDAVVVYDLDRLYRQPLELEEFVRACDSAGVTELAAVTGDIDLASGDGLLMARVKGAVAAKESDDKSRRIKRKALELAQDGKVGGGGTRPFGFEDNRKTIRRAEGTVISEAGGRVLAGESVRSICFDLNARGILTSTGGEWVPNVLTRMLKSARISGRREHHGEIVATAEWPAIIDAATSDRLRAVLSDPSRRKNERARSYLLASMLTCGHCDEPLTSRPSDDGRRRYVCGRRPGSKACGKIAVLAEPLEELIVETTLHRLEGPALTRALAAQNGDREDVHQREVDEANAHLEELARAYGEQRVSATEWMAAKGPIDERLRRGKAGLARSNGTSAVAEFIGQGSALRSAWSGLPFSRRRAILSAVLGQATINPARRGFNRFDPERVALQWRA